MLQACQVSLSPSVTKFKIELTYDGTIGIF